MWPWRDVFVDVVSLRLLIYSFGSQVRLTRRETVKMALRLYVNAYALLQRGQKQTEKGFLMWITFVCHWADWQCTLCSNRGWTERRSSLTQQMRIELLHRKPTRQDALINNKVCCNGARWASVGNRDQNITGGARCACACRNGIEAHWGAFQPTGQPGR